MTVRFHPEAEGEFGEAILWYEHQRSGLGSELVLCDDEAIERIRRSPESYPKVYKTIRRIVIRRFPLHGSMKLWVPTFGCLQSSIPDGILPDGVHESNQPVHTSPA